jgi:hypothetical protein
VERIQRLPENDRSSLLSSRGTYSRERIRYEYNLSESVARAVVAGLSMAEGAGRA